VKFFLAIETIALLAGAWVVWRRSRVDEPRRGRALAFFVLALALYVGVNVAADALLGQPGARTATVGAIVLLALQVVRALLLAWAVGLWLVAVRARLVRSWRGVMILICLAFITLIPPSTIAFGLLMLLPLARLRWMKGVHGWARVGLVVAFGVLTFALSTRFDITLSSGGVGNVTATLGSGGGSTIVEGSLPPLVDGIVALSRPWEHAIRVLLLLVRLAVGVAFFQLLVVPIRLRGLSIKRRFTVTLAMYRFIPGTLGLVFFVLTAYMGIGLHRATLVTNTFDATLEQALHTAATTATRPIGSPPPPVSIHPEDRSYAVVRTLEWATNPEDTTGREGWVAKRSYPSPGTPPAVVAGNEFAAMTADTAIGLVERGGALYLRAGVIRHSRGSAVGSEVFVQVDSTYLAHIAERIQSDVNVSVSPNVFVGETEVSIEGDSRSGWADSSYTVSAPFLGAAHGDELPDRTIYLARNFLPVGDWLEPLRDNRVGAVQLKLYTTPRTLYRSITGNSFMLTSQAFALIILVVIALLFIIVELSAVRTGRSIVKGIVSDVKVLTEAAARFGRGDLAHRVALSGKDEMGRLAATFNSMAESIEQNQEILLEKERLEADLSLAREIQQRMLPQSPPSIPGLDVAGLSIPSREVGGDLFYFLPVANGRLGITIGDVSGKSVPAALLMSNVLAALKSEARIVDKEDEILGHLNRLIVEQVEPGRFVTFFYGVVDPRERVLRYACAGHNPPLLMRASGDTRWLKEAGVPLGVVPESTYSPHEIALEPDDVIVLYSDGVTEAQRTPAPPEADERDEDAPPPEQEFFDEARLEAVVRDARGKSAAGIVADVMQAVRSFTEGEEQSDDLTLVVVRIASP
jgi:serine phosphatase RsbU (regulator of sigma subunit)